MVINSEGEPESVIPFVEDRLHFKASFIVHYMKDRKRQKREEEGEKVSVRENMRLIYRLQPKNLKVELGSTYVSYEFQGPGMCRSRKLGQKQSHDSKPVAL